MIQFKKYNSIENTFDKEFMERIIIEECDKQEYVVQEKVHGANVCLITDGETVSFGKRTGFVEAGEKFYDLTNYTPTDQIPAVLPCRQFSQGRGWLHISTCYRPEQAAAVWHVRA